MGEAKRRKQINNYSYSKPKEQKYYAIWDNVNQKHFVDCSYTNLFNSKNQTFVVNWSKTPRLAKIFKSINEAEKIAKKLLDQNHHTLFIIEVKNSGEYGFFESVKKISLQN